MIATKIKILKRKKDKQQDKLLILDMILCS